MFGLTELNLFPWLPVYLLCRILLSGTMSMKNWFPTMVSFPVTLLVPFHLQDVCSDLHLTLGPRHWPSWKAVVHPLPLHCCVHFSASLVLSSAFTALETLSEPDKGTLLQDTQLLWVEMLPLYSCFINNIFFHCIIIAGRRRCQVLPPFHS